VFKLIYTARNDSEDYVYLKSFFNELESVDPTTYDFFCRTTTVSLDELAYGVFILDPGLRVVPETAVRVWRI